jgi:putative efflux protein, MATE family
MNEAGIIPVEAAAPGERGSPARFFSNRDLFSLFLPLVIEQFLEYSVGLASSIMVAHIGESAVSGVSLGDFVMALLISVFNAIATGGAVIAGQFLGKKAEGEARKSAGQLLKINAALGLAIMALVYLGRSLILRGLFGSISGEVYDDAAAYLSVVTASIPFIAIYAGGAAIFRTMGDSRLPMRIMLAMNGLNIACSALFILGLGWGTASAGLASLISRAGAALLILAFARNPRLTLSARGWLAGGFDWKLVKMILGIGLPFGIENGMFYFGRIVVLSLVATFGTAAIAANAVAGTIVMFEVLPGMAIGLGLTVIVSRCAGASDYEQARYYTKKVMKVIYGAHVASSAIVLALLPAILGLYGLSAQATEWARQLAWAHAIMMLLIWPIAYTLPVTFRAAGDAKFPMAVSMLSMVFCRIALSYVFGLWLGLGMLGTWAAMFVDWIVKAAIFAARYASGRWTRYRATGERLGDA